MIGLALAASLALPAFAENEPLKVYKNEALGFSFDYPADFSVKASSQTASVFADADDEDPLFSVEARGLSGLSVEVPTRGVYRYDQKKNEWRPTPGDDETALSRLEITDLTAANIPAYESPDPAEDGRWRDTILTDRGFALVFSFQKSGRDILNSLKLTPKTKPLTASIAEPPPPDGEEPGGNSSDQGAGTRLAAHWEGFRCLERPAVSDSWMVRDAGKWRWLWSQFSREEAPAINFDNHFALAVLLNGPEARGRSFFWPPADNRNGGYLVHYRVVPDDRVSQPCAYAIRVYAAPHVKGMLPLKIQVVRDRRTDRKL
jgi:hypothetical protein